MIDKQFTKECEIRTVVSVHYSSIESLIDRHFKTPLHRDRYELPCLEERGSGSDEDWEITIRKETMSDYDMRPIVSASQGKWEQFSTREFLTYLCNHDIIPAGNYLIDISW